MKLSEFAKGQKTHNENNVDKEKKTEKKSKTYEDLYNEYKDLPNDELLKSLFQEVQKQKQNGTFDFLKLQKSVDLIKPYLNDMQKNNIADLMEKLK